MSQYFKHRRKNQYYVWILQVKIEKYIHFIKKNQIPLNEREEVFNLAGILTKSWELAEIAALQSDIDRQIKYQESFGQPIKEILETL